MHCDSIDAPLNARGDTCGAGLVMDANYFADLLCEQPGITCAHHLSGLAATLLASDPSYFAGGGSARPSVAGAKVPPSSTAGKGCNSFVAGTRVLMADAIAKNIEDVKVGDIVANSRPESRDLGRDVVTAIHITEHDTDYNTLTIETRDGPRYLVTTSHHPFYSITSRAWVDAEDLKPGDLLQAPFGHVEVRNNELEHTSARTYNLSIALVHTFYVLAGDTPILVHNRPPDRCSFTTPSGAPTINSKTVFTSKDGSFRVDIENQNPGHPGAGIHVQFMGRGADQNKYYYNPSDNTWETEGGDRLSSRIARQIPASAIQKAYKYFGW